MVLVSGARRSGKTSSLIKLADNKNGYIVCHDMKTVDMVARLAVKLGCDINYPMTFEELKTSNYKGDVFIDNIELCLRQSISPNIRCMTMTSV